MRLSTRARYAVRMLLDINKHSIDNQPVSLHDIAIRTRISRKYLEQLAMALKSSDLIKGFSGKKGGYVLKRPASQITIGDIVQATIGAINITDCVENIDNCMSADYCVCRLVWCLINHKIIDVLNEYTLKDLASKDCVKELSSELARYSEVNRAMVKPTE